MMVSTQVEKSSQIGSFLHIKVEINNAWNHHLDTTVFHPFQHILKPEMIARDSVFFDLIPKPGMATSLFSYMNGSLFMVSM